MYLYSGGTTSLFMGLLCNTVIFMFWSIIMLSFSFRWYRLLTYYILMGHCVTHQFSFYRFFFCKSKHVCFFSPHLTRCAYKSCAISGSNKILACKFFFSAQQLLQKFYNYQITKSFIFYHINYIINSVIDADFLEIFILCWTHNITHLKRFLS